MGLTKYFRRFGQVEGVFVGFVDKEEGSCRRVLGIEGWMRRLRVRVVCRIIGSHKFWWRR